MRHHLEIPGNQSLYRLAEAIVASFGFDFDHAFGFYDDLGRNFYGASVRYELFADMEATGGWGKWDDAPKAGSVKRTKIAQALSEPEQKLQFVFDYGDEWCFEIELSGFGAKTKGVKYPRILASKGKSPEQYPDWEDE